MSREDTVKIKSVINGGDNQGEILLKLKSDCINDCSGFDFNVYSDLNNPSKTSVVASKDGISYCGVTDDNSLSQNYLIIVKKKKNKRIAKLLKIKTCDLSEVKTGPAGGRRPSDLDDFHKRNLLTDKFGSKRSKRKMDLNIKMRVDAEACKAQLKPILEETVLDESYLLENTDGTELLQKLIPPCNRFASTPQGVYSLESLLSQKECESLVEAAEYFIENPPTEEDYGRFLVLNYEIISQNINVEKVILLLYADTLLKLIKVHPKEKKTREGWNKISPYSDLIVSKLIRDFTESRIVTVQMRHKAACYALVAILLACGYKIHYDCVSTFFNGINSQKFQQLCSLVGLTSQVKGVSDILALKVPLPPLPVARSPKKKRR